MKTEGTAQTKKCELRVELKYCEGCGGLGVRECGGGQIYCNRCAARMEELAIARASRRPSLPVGNRSRLDDAADSNGREFEDEDPDEADLKHPGCELGFEDLSSSDLGFHGGSKYRNFQRAFADFAVDLGGDELNGDRPNGGDLHIGESHNPDTYSDDSRATTWIAGGAA